MDLLRHTRAPRLMLSLVIALLGVVALIVSPVHASGEAEPYRAFSPASYWNRPLPLDAPRHRDSAEMIAWLAADNAGDSVVLAGTSGSGAWGMPIYWADSDDPSYQVRGSCPWRIRALSTPIRIPRGARPDPTSDAAMVIYDLAAGTVSALHRARFDEATGTWSACSAASYSLDSKGLESSVPSSDDPTNVGHRGLPPPTYAVRWDEIEAGEINHVLRIAVNTTGCEHVLPMTGDECGTFAAFAPAEGTRIRIKPEFDLDSVRLSPAARVIATALQEYGAVVGDQSGGEASVKVENTIAQGQGWRWQGVLERNSLSEIPLSAFEVIQDAYLPPQAP